MSEVPKKSKKKQVIICSVIFAGFAVLLGTQLLDYNKYFDKPFSTDELKTLHTIGKSVMVYPIFTQIAYGDNGFYSYYKQVCDSRCLTVKFNPFNIKPSYNTGQAMYEKLVELGYPVVTDMQIDQHPDILKGYNTIILLHNEYMTKNEFNTIKAFPHVLYLYPNSMYAEIKADYKNDTIQLIRGHGYPSHNISNGFGYQTGSTHEYDIKCNDYKWNKMPNGLEISCYPELLAHNDHDIFKFIQKY